MIWRQGCATGMRKTARLTPRMVTASSGFWAKTATAGSPTLSTGWNGTAAAISWALSRISPPYVDLREKLEQHQRKIGVPQCQLPRKGELFCFCRSAPESDQPGEAFQAVPRSKKAAAQKVQRLCGVSHHSQRSEMIHQIPGRLIRPSRCSNTISMVFSFQTVRFSRTDPSAKTEAA